MLMARCCRAIRAQDVAARLKACCVSRSAVSTATLEYGTCGDGIAHIDRMARTERTCERRLMLLDVVPLRRSSFPPQELKPCGFQLVRFR